MKLYIVPLASSAAFWLLLSGHYNAITLGLGICSCLLVVYIAHRMDVADHEGHPLHLVTWKILLYNAWLLKEIILSSVAVARLAVSPRLNLQPRLAELPAHDMTDIEKVIYANSITLTPGTLTTDVTDTHVHVHTIHEQMLGPLFEGGMARRLLNATLHPSGKKSGS